MTSTAGNQWIRKASLTLSAGAKAIDLSAFRFRFKTQFTDIQTPNTAQITVTNLGRSTAAAAAAEFTQVSLMAGYQTGAFGLIFSGTIKQTIIGKESPVDSFLTLFCGDGDTAHNWGVISVTLAAGAKPNDQVNAVLAALNPFGVTAGYIPQLTGAGLPRGKVLHGMVRDVLADLADTTGTDWSIQNNTLQMVSRTGYLPGDAVVLNARTGLIGVPRQTQNGIYVRCLLNPQLRAGGLIQLDNAELATLNVKEQGYPGYGDVTIVAPTNADGLYRIIALDYSGDTRGPDWSCELTCVSRDASVPIAQANQGRV